MLQECIVDFLILSRRAAWCCFFHMMLHFVTFYAKCYILQAVYYILPVNILASHSLYIYIWFEIAHIFGASPLASPLWTSQAVSNELCHSVLRSLVWTSKSRSMARSLGLWQVLSCAMFEHVCANFVNWSWSSWSNPWRHHWPRKVLCEHAQKVKTLTDGIWKVCIRCPDDSERCALPPNALAKYPQCFQPVVLCRRRLCETARSLARTREIIRRTGIQRQTDLPFAESLGHSAASKTERESCKADLLWKIMRNRNLFIYSIDMWRFNGVKLKLTINKFCNCFNAFFVFLGSFFSANLHHAAECWWPVKPIVYEILNFLTHPLQTSVQSRRQIVRRRQRPKSTHEAEEWHKQGKLEESKTKRCKK